MTSQIIRISYDGPYSQLSTAPTSVSITVRDLFDSTNFFKFSQDAINNSQTQQDEKQDMSLE